MERKPRRDREREKEFEERVVTINSVTKVVKKNLNNALLRSTV